MEIIKEGSVRVDLLGGTIDLVPINLILHRVITLNVATSLKAKVQLKRTSESGIKIKSSDYNNEFFFQKSLLHLKI